MIADITSKASFYYKICISCLYAFSSIQYNYSFSCHKFQYIYNNQRTFMTNVKDESNINNNADDPILIKNLPSPLILGSASFTRKLILTEMGINHELLVRPIDEKNIGNRLKDKPSDLVLKLAIAKANHLLKEIDASISDNDFPLFHREEGWLVLTADQVVTHNGAILEKPTSINEAKEFVEGYAHSPPSTVGSCVITHFPSLIQVSGVDTSEIKFRSSISDCNMIERLVDDDAPVLKCAGGLMIEHPFVREHIDCINGTEDSVMGLSKDLVLRLLNEMKGKLKVV